MRNNIINSFSTCCCQLRNKSIGGSGKSPNATSFIASVLLLISSIVFSSTVLSVSAYAQGSAEPHSFTFFQEFPEPADCTVTGGGQRAVAGKIKTFFAKYHALDKDFTIDVLFERCEGNGALANGFSAVFNAGANPKGHSGELAILYLDGRDASNPIFTMYGYNGTAGSYLDGQRNDDYNGIPGVPGLQTPDRILSSLAGDNFVVEAEITEPQPNQRRFYVRFSVAQVNQHNPLYPVTGVEWDGMLFNTSFGGWFHPTVLNGTTRYCQANRTSTNLPCGASEDSTGYLENWGYTQRGWFDSAHRTANGSPSCQYKLTGNAEYNSQRGCYEVYAGDTISASFALNDYEEDDFNVRYNHGLPAAAQFSPRGPEVNFSGSGDINLSWTPSQGDVSSDIYPVWLMINDEHGAMAECGIDVCVQENLAPLCNITFTDPTPEQCDGDITKLAFTTDGSRDPENKTLRFEWTTTCPNSSVTRDFVINNFVPRTGSLVLNDPGDGIAVNGCELILTVSDGTNSTSCSTPVNVNACELDCDGVANGDGELDDCGICNGDNSTCSDCNGVPNGDAIVDTCGVCDGDGTSCAPADCNGTPNGTAQVDSCGVCNGNGLSCIPCVQTDISAFQLAGDGRSRDIRRLINQDIVAQTLRLTEITRGRVPSGLQAWADNTRLAATRLYEGAWGAIWSNDSIQIDCDGSASALCVTVNNESNLSAYNFAVSESQTLAENSIRRLRRAARRAGKAQGFTTRRAKRKARRLVNNILARLTTLVNAGFSASASIPAQTISCG